MKAQAMTAFGEPLTPMELTPQKPGAGEALVRVTRAGLCHSDLHIHDGYFDFGDVRQPVAMNMPAVLGHEIEGEIAELGEGVSGPAIGTRVAVYPWLGCNACDTCRTGDQQLCIALPRRALGVAQWGGMAEYVHVPFADALIPIGDLTP
ncbi:MAG: alcohol dehydrogenase catalytic domain-containing protein, partial [Hyphomonadaceae bacterium]|nr:alcohol dehydrogenase catalytic domain-containing protein [Hyphomonadaceae bacterium]